MREAGAGRQGLRRGGFTQSHREPRGNQEGISRVLGLGLAMFLVKAGEGGEGFGVGRIEVEYFGEMGAGLGPVAGTGEKVGEVEVSRGVGRVDDEGLLEGLAGFGGA